ncbi:MAG: hypothetical protein GQF41_1717 [Candidatus Rifleibacterium amylolyticum]|nr:MAG: hypothetical protein GQF41_1717 [Candidatus Rifleibacterium amylolyticum]
MRRPSDFSAGVDKKYNEEQNGTCIKPATAYSMKITAAPEPFFVF